MHPQHSFFSSRTNFLTVHVFRRLTSLASLSYGSGECQDFWHLIFTVNHCQTESLTQKRPWQLWPSIFEHIHHKLLTLPQIWSKLSATSLPDMPQQFFPSVSLVFFFSICFWPLSFFFVLGLVLHLLSPWSSPCRQSCPPHPPPPPFLLRHPAAGARSSDASCSYANSP